MSFWGRNLPLKEESFHGKSHTQTRTDDGCRTFFVFADGAAGPAAAPAAGGRTASASGSCEGRSGVCLPGRRYAVRVESESSRSAALRQGWQALRQAFCGAFLGSE